NVRTNDTLGDGTAGENVTSLNGATTGSYRSEERRAGKNYRYTLNNELAAEQQLAPGETLAETYSYTLTDKDGDTSSANLVITITGTDGLRVEVAYAGELGEDVVCVVVNVRTNDTLGDGTAGENVTSLNGATTGSY